MTGPSFGTAVTCIDGRVHRPVILWLRERYGLDYIDIVSEPGPDKLLAEGWPGDIAPVRKKVGFSVEAHASRLIAVSGHYDCAGNPASPEEHWAQIRAGVRQVRSWGLPADAIGLWVNDQWQIEVIEPPLRTPEVGAASSAVAGSAGEA